MIKQIEVLYQSIYIRLIKKDALNTELQETPGELGRSLGSFVTYMWFVFLCWQAADIITELSGGMSGKAEPDDVPILPHK